MIETKTLGAGVGIQRQDVIDKSETTIFPSLVNGVIVGYFKRGRQDKVFKVTSDNYRTLLGRDPNNPHYMMVEDVFERGVSEISILRIGDSNKTPLPPVIIPPVVPPKPTAPPAPPNAITSSSGWYLKDHAIAGDVVALNAVKQTSLGGLKSSINATATNAELIESLLIGNSADALNYAVTGLLGAGVVWELDATNQRISYTAIL